ncbi:type I-F CRISPR-associated protein Csy3 [Pseudaeromonas sp. ZJS20]|uniref:type I-F CRISPR-associated protein Csy3 n=1 Tax=Pseudaeromonas aegiceratis TaxID=3153928 RepID=UPI00390C568A
MAAKKSAKSSGAEMAAVLSVTRRMTMSDGVMSSKLENGKLQPIQVIRHGIRGTQNVAKQKDEVAQIQVTESAKTAPDAIGLHVKFQIMISPLIQAVSACDTQEIAKQINAFIEAGKNSRELTEICRRYARRIFSGTFLWRNLTLAQDLTIEVRSGSFEAKVSGNEPFELFEKGFSDYTENEIKLAEVIKGQLVQGRQPGSKITVEATVGFGQPGAFEVYPSQVYVSGKPKGFARPLYKLEPIGLKELHSITNNKDVLTFSDMIPMGIAALRDQKIGNAIRTIDIEYAEGENIKPIAVEPNGANLEDNVYYRDFKTGKSAFDLLRLSTLSGLTNKLAEPHDDLIPEALFLLAVLIRGGVFGEKDESKSDAKSAKEAD